MKTQKTLKIVRFCLPVIILMLGGEIPLTAQETSDFWSLVVLDKSQEAESTASPAASIGESPKPKQFSWKAQPLPKVKSFLITEFGLRYNLFRPESEGNDPLINVDFTGDLGFMVNKNERFAQGLVFAASLGIDPDYIGKRWKLGLKPRFRRWLNKKFSVDLSPGLIYKLQDVGSVSSQWKKNLGFSGELGLNLSWLSLYSQFEVIPGSRIEYTYQSGSWQAKKKTETGLYAGLKLGG